MIKKHFTLLWGITGDLFRRWMPAPKEKKIFAFIGHPRSSREAVKKFPFLKYLPEKTVRFFLKNIIITATNAAGMIIKSGAIVIDDAQPSDVDAAVIKERSDVLVIEGGIVKTDTIACHINLNLAGRNDIFSCLAETMAIAAHKKNGHYTVGLIDMNRVEEMSEMALRLGFRLSPFQNRYGYIPEEYLQRIKRIRAGEKPND